MFVAPPMGTTKTPSRPRLRPLRAASASIADWSLTPSTRMTAHEPAGTFRTAATAAASAALLLPAGPVTATRRDSDSSSTVPSLAAGGGRASQLGGRRIWAGLAAAVWQAGTDHRREQ